MRQLLAIAALILAGCQVVGAGTSITAWLDSESSIVAVA